VPKLSRFVLTTAAAMLALVACAGPADELTPDDRLYISLGDSYAAGYRPTAAGEGTTTTDGFAYQVADRARAAGDPLRLVNFGCSGITSAQLRAGTGCAPGALGPGAADYGSLSQVDAATQFLTRYHRQVALVTVIVGGNDVKPCFLTESGAIRTDAMSCTPAAIASLRTNLAATLTRIRAAVGPGVLVIGLTYPDMFLGAWVSSSPDGHAIANGSVELFRDLLNTALRAEYTRVGAAFADITAATGGYGSLADMTSDPTYGTIPVPVARACELTYFCGLGDVHPTVSGYRLIAEQVLDVARLS
jgi:lysophospholipase L1-like esterase